MSEHIYKKIEITGTSPNSIEEAVNRAITKASQTIQHLRWFEVTETRGSIKEGKVESFQVTLKVGFVLESGD